MAGQQGAYAAHLINRGFLPLQGGMDQVEGAWMQPLEGGQTEPCLRAPLQQTDNRPCYSRSRNTHATPAWPAAPPPHPPQPPPCKPVSTDNLMGNMRDATMGDDEEGAVRRPAWQRLLGRACCMRL